MKSRHRAREVALQILYRHDIEQQGKSPEGALSASQPDAQQVISDLRAHFDHFQVSEDLREFAAQLVAGTLRESAELDALIEKTSSNWKIARMPCVDRALLRMSTYELIHFPETPASIVIDEALELAKQFGTAETSAFVNGILDAIRKSRA